MKKLIIANWKMHPASLGETQKLIHEINKLKVPRNVSLVICPSFIHLPLIKSKFPLGAQDAFVGDVGPFTGEVSAEMLKNIGVRYVILGHSERRINLKENDQLIARKVKSVLKEGLEVILCIVEPLNIRRKGFAASKTFVKNQLQECLALLEPKERAEVIVTYEPIWAISTMPGASADSPKEAVKMISFIKGMTKGRVIYGGSVNAQNAFGFLDKPEIDGVLVGGASLKVAEFKKVVSATSTA
jgi:triosephosphate isomerase